MTEEFGMLILPAFLSEAPFAMRSVPFFIENATIIFFCGGGCGSSLSLSLLLSEDSLVDFVVDIRQSSRPIDYFL